VSDPADTMRAGAEGAEGAIEMIIAAENGKVIQRFERPTLYVAYERDNAAHVGKCLIDTAVAIGAQVVIKTPPRKISKAKIEALVTRAYHVHRSMTEKHRAPMLIAQHVVDSILSALES